MKNNIYLAQKALCFNEERNKILVIKYIDAEFNAKELIGKYGLPGGKMEFGETPEQTLIREVREETGVVLRPIVPFDFITWKYKKPNEMVQIVANIWLASIEANSIKEPISEKEVKLQKARWMELKKLNAKNFVEDELPTIKKYTKFRKKSPFIF